MITVDPILLSYFIPGYENALWIVCTAAHTRLCWGSLSAAAVTPQACRLRHTERD